MSSLLVHGDLQSYEIADAWRELFGTELELFDYRRPYTALELWAKVPLEIRGDLLRCIYDLREGTA